MSSHKRKKYIVTKLQENEDNETVKLIKINKNVSPR
jgi:hypothetical protein